MKKFLGCSPPFTVFLNTKYVSERKLIFENYRLGGSLAERSDSIQVL